MDILKDLQSKVGLSEDKAKKVLDFLKDNAGSVTKYLGGGVSSIGAAVGIGGESFDMPQSAEELMAQADSDSEE